MRQIHTSSAALACALAVACLQVATAADSLGSCAGIDDDAARLACYDRIAGRGQATTTAEAVALPTPAAGVAVASTAAAPTTAAPAAAAQAAGEHDFGLSEADKKARDPEKYRESVPESITRPVRSVTSDAYGRFVVTLDDGQVWAQVEMESAVRPPKAGDVVTISLAALGSYKLRSERTRLTRVRRVK